MTQCLLSHSTEYLTVAGACGIKCQGVTFNLDYCNTSNDEEGRCVFDWQVTRSSPTGNTTFADEHVVDCGSSQVIFFYCDPAKGCKRYQLTLTCDHP